MAQADCKFNLKCFQQQTNFSCGAAVARTALFSLTGLEVDEAELTSVLGTTEELGTKRESFQKIVGFAEKLGARLCCDTGTEGSYERVAELLTSGHVVFLNYFEPEDDDPHWTTVQTVSDTTIVLADPWHGPDYRLGLDDFVRRWRSGFADEKGVFEKRPWVALRLAG